jgi:hypothetical protein
MSATPLYTLAERPDGTFKTDAAQTGAVTLRIGWADWRAGKRADAEAYLNQMQPGTSVVVVLTPTPAPAGIPSMVVGGVSVPLMHDAANVAAFGADTMAVCEWVAERGFIVTGAGISFSTMAEGDAEFCFAGASDPAAVTAWAAAGYRPSLVNAAFQALTAQLYAGGIPYMRLPVLDPRTGTLPIAEDGSILAKPDLTVPDGWFDAALAGVGGAQGVIAPYDLNLGEHGLSTFVQEVSNRTGVAGGQLHANLTADQIRAGVAEADRQALAMLECHQGALPGA